jgi:hypothetical protein
VQPALIEKIKTSQASDSQLTKIIDGVQNGKRLEFNVSDVEILRFGNRLCAPND